MTARSISRSSHSLPKERSLSHRASLSRTLRGFVRCAGGDEGRPTGRFAAGGMSGQDRQASLDAHPGEGSSIAIRGRPQLRPVIAPVAQPVDRVEILVALLCSQLLGKLQNLLGIVGCGFVAQALHHVVGVAHVALQWVVCSADVCFREIVAHETPAAEIEGPACGLNVAARASVKFVALDGLFARQGCAIAPVFSAQSDAAISVAVVGNFHKFCHLAVAVAFKSNRVLHEFAVFHFYLRLLDRTALSMGINVIRKFGECKNVVVTRKTEVMT